MVEPIKDIVSVLALLAGAAAFVLFLIAAGSAVVAAYRVGSRRRPLVMTFAGSDESRVALTTLFAMRMMKVEREWVQLAGAVKAAQSDFNKEYAASARPVDFEEGRTPLAEGERLPEVGGDARAGSGLAGAGSGPRTVGDESIDYVLELESGQNTLGDIDLGIVGLAGVSFSPQALLALLGRLPAACARRRISGTVAQLGETSIVAATYEERNRGAPTRRAQRLVTVEGDWLGAIDTLAFRLAKGRLEIIRERPPGPKARAVAEEQRSETAQRGFIEADSWAAAKAFLAAYERHFRHYTSGTAADRDRAIELYGEAIERQPGYMRAHYNRGTLLYNRYRNSENDEAIADFERATKSGEDRLRALAFAGLAMAYGQQVHRFRVGKEVVLAKAKDASEQALELDDTVEESWFAGGWALQIEERWSEAVEAYAAVSRIASTSVPGKRIKSFALNNSAWLALNRLPGQREALLRDAERRLWEAVVLYPNKIAYANLAAIARERGRFADAATLFDHALRLDSRYVNGWHEYALLELEWAASCRGAERERHLAAAHARQATAERVGDEADRERLRPDFDDAVAATGLAPATV